MPDLERRTHVNQAVRDVQAVVAATVHGPDLLPAALVNAAAARVVSRRVAPPPLVVVGASTPALHNLAVIVVAIRDVGYRAGNGEPEEVGAVVEVDAGPRVVAPQEDHLGAEVAVLNADTEGFVGSSVKPDLPQVGAGLEAGRLGGGRLRSADQLGGTYGSGGAHDSEGGQEGGESNHDGERCWMVTSES